MGLKGWGMFWREGGTQHSWGLEARAREAAGEAERPRGTAGPLSGAHDAQRGPEKHFHFF